MTAFFNTGELGNYEILVNLSSKNPKYTDWGKIYVKVQRIDAAGAQGLILFTEEFRMIFLFVGIKLGTTF